MRRVRGDVCLFLVIAMLPVVGFMALVSAAVMSLTATESGADTPTFALACNAGGIKVSLPTNAAEGVLSPTTIQSGGAVSLVANTADVPNSGVAGANLLNGPDTGLGFVIVFPATLEGLIPAGSSVGFSGSVPLALTGGTGNPSMNVSGTFTAPATFPTNPGVVVSGTMAGSITAGAAGTLSVAVPQFTTASPLTLTIALGTAHLPIACTSAGAETIGTATVTGGSTGSTTTTVPTKTTTSSTSTTTTSRPTTGQANTSNPTSDSPPSATTAADSASTPSTAAHSSAPTAAANTLAFTGPGPDLWILAVGGILLIDLGYLVLTIYYRPRELFAIAGRKIRRMLGGT